MSVLESFYYVYVLSSSRDKSLYIGYTTNLKQRLQDHNSGRNTSTKSKIPWKVIYSEAYRNKADALGREKFLKGGSGRKYLNKQLKHYLSERDS